VFRSVITDVQLRETPFFRHFRSDQNTFEEHMYDGTALLAPLGDSTASAMANLPFTQYKLLAEAIPARSFAVGANFLNDFGVGRNFDMQGMQNGWPAERLSGQHADSWLHGDIRAVAYLYVHEVFDTVVEEGGLK